VPQNVSIMENIDFIRVGIGLGVVLILLGAFYWAMKYFAGNMRIGKWRSGQRIGVVELAPVDGTRRLALVRRDGVEHLLLLGDDGDLVIETGIPVTKETDAATRGEGGNWPSLRLPGRDGPGAS
jgi:flagellar protein FliO/FliZ